MSACFSFVRSKLLEKVWSTDRLTDTGKAIHSDPSIPVSATYWWYYNYANSTHIILFLTLTTNIFNLFDIYVCFSFSFLFSNNKECSTQSNLKFAIYMWHE